MNQASLRHVDTEALAAFIDGALPTAEMEQVTRHINNCSECRLLLRGAVAFAREERATERRPVSWMALAATVLIAVVAVPKLRPMYGRWVAARAVRELRVTVADTGRNVQARITGFPWAPLIAQRGDDRGARGQKKLSGVAVKVLDRVEPSRTTEQFHAAGLAHLLGGDRLEGAEALEAAAARSSDSAVWSDLAAARDAIAMSDRQYAQLPRALAAADRALRFDAKSPEAPFNRALILQHMGLRDAAREQWEKYLALDGTSNWATEARSHLDQIDRERSRIDFDRELERATAAGPDALVEFARKYPGEARVRAEGPGLAVWAKALLAGDEATADKQLEVVQQIAAAVTAANGDMLVGDAVDAIRRAGPPNRLLLAEAHAVYDEGRTLINKRSYVAAETRLREAAALFRRAGSPLADVALYFASIGTFNQNRIDEARTQLLGLVSRCDRKRHPALCAQEMWQLGLCDSLIGSWTAALDESLTALRVFTAQREVRYEVMMRGIVADLYDHVAEDDEAWRQRSEVLATLSRRGDDGAVLGVLANAIRSAIRDRRFDAAAALANVAIDGLRRVKAPVLLADTLLQHARATAELGEPPERLAEARRAASQIADPALRQRAEMDLLVVEGIAARARDPRRAVALMSSAIDFYARNRLGIWLVEAYRQRSLAYASAGDSAEAMRDIDRAMAELDRQRSTLSDADARSKFLNTAPQVFEQAVGLFMRYGELERAFAAAERGRGRTLREQLSTGEATASTAAIRASLHPGTAIIEYALTPSGITVFCLTSSQINARTIDVDREHLRRLISEMRRTIRNRAPLSDFHRAAEALDAILIAPVRAQIGNADNLVIVADRELQGVPFAGLRNGSTGRYVLEEHAITLAPSAALWKPARPRPIGTALFIGNPTAPGFDDLPGAERQATIAAALHDGSLVLLRENASRERFLELAPMYSLIEFAGHARAGMNEPPALVFSPRGTGGELLHAADIARMPLARTSLVVLAACASGSGATESVEGVPSLTAAFLAAGVPAVVGTLWNIDDQFSADVFGVFHKQLAAGNSPARSLQSAQLAALRSSDAALQHPGTWAPIELWEHNAR